MSELLKCIIIYEKIFYLFLLIHRFSIFTDKNVAFFITIFIYLFTLWCCVVDLDIV